MPVRRVARVVAALLAAGALVSPAATAQPAPSPADAIAPALARLRNSQTPDKVDDALASLQKAMRWWKCGKDSPKFSAVDVIVLTSIVAWDPKGKKEGAAGNFDAFTSFREEQHVDGERLIRAFIFTTELSFEPARLAARERQGAPLGSQLVSEVILYHELLHAQYFIERLFSTFETQLEAVCAGGLPKGLKAIFPTGDLEAAEESVIDPQLDRYLKANQEGRGYAYSRSTVKVPPSKEKAFSVELPFDRDLPKDPTTYKWDEGVRVTKVTRVDARKVRVEGERTSDAGGWVRLIVDPPERIDSFFILVPGDPARVTLLAVDRDRGVWHVRRPAAAAAQFSFGDVGDVPLLGDWDCDGSETPGAYRPSTGWVYLRNRLSSGPPHVAFRIGEPGDVALAGDFDGDGCDTVSVYRPATATMHRHDALGAGEDGPGAPDQVYEFGDPGDVPVTGDFDGDGIDTLAVRRASGRVFVRQEHAAGVADLSFVFGDAGDQVVAADWDGDGVDTVAVFRPDEARLYLRNSLTSGLAHDAFYFGEPGWAVVGGGVRE